ncbi:hypothetical protein Tco_0324437, partial [Tanacetum coccineum]
LGSLPVPLQHMEWKPDYKGNFCKKEEGDGQWHAEIRLTDPYRNVYDQDWNVLNTLGCDTTIEDMLEIRVNEIRSDEVLFTSEAWKRAFDINEPIYTELCHEFYATFEFDEAVADDELMTKKAIKFRLCGKAYAMNVLDFSKCLVDEEQRSWTTKRKFDLLTLDANILRELIGSNGRLIPEEIAPSIPRVVTPKALRPTTSDVYDKISQLETRIGEIERMMRRESYHLDGYVRV